MTFKKTRRDIISAAVICAVTAILFYLLTRPFHNLFPVFELSEIRPSAVMNPVFGLFFGVPGALGCTIGNMFIDISYGVGFPHFIIYMIPQFLYGIVPRLIWNALYKKDTPDRFRLDSMPKILRFCGTMIVTSLVLGVTVSIAAASSMPDVISFGLFCFINDTAICLLLGFAVLILLNWIFNRSKPCRCERLLLYTTAAELVGIAMTVFLFKQLTGYENLLEVAVLDRIYVLSLVVISVIILVALVLIGLSLGQQLHERKYDLQIAASIQASMLPEKYDGSDRRVSLYASMTPAREVGGDFYDHFFLSEDKLAFVVADVSGKGTPAALFMTRAISTLRDFSSMGIPIEEIMDRTNDSLCRNNKEKYFVTAWLGILDLSSGELTFVNAGHNPPVLRHADGKAELVKTKSSPILGALEGIHYRHGTLTLEKGDTLFIYTDGVTEAHNKKGEMFREAGMTAAVEKAPVSADGLCAAVFDAVNAFAAGAEQFDDITMMAVRYQEVQDE